MRVGRWKVRMEGTVNESKYPLVNATVEFLKEFVVDDGSFKESSSREVSKEKESKEQPT